MAGLKSRNLMLAALFCMTALSGLFLCMQQHDYRILVPPRRPAALALCFHAPETAVSGGPIPVEFGLMNEGGAVIRLALPDRPVEGFTVQVQRARSKTTDGRTGSGVMMPMRAASSAAFAPKTLPPGGSLVWGIDLAQLYDLPPGDYVLTAVYQPTVLARALKVDLNVGGYDTAYTRRAVVGLTLTSSP